MTNEEFIKSITIDGELWHDVVGWEGHYVVSTFGRIVSLGRCVKGRYSLITKKPKLLKQTLMANIGYLCVMFSRNNKPVQQLVHRIVAEAFIPNQDNKSCIDHIDTDRTNNHVENLRWCTKNENMKNIITKNNLSIIQQSREWRTQPRPVIALKDNVCLKTYKSITSVLKDGHDTRRVVLVCKGKARSHHGYKWMYLSDYETLVNQKVKERLPET